jgi:hypothetical protein
MRCTLRASLLRRSNRDRRNSDVIVIVVGDQVPARRVVDALKRIALKRIAKLRAFTRGAREPVRIQG